MLNSLGDRSIYGAKGDVSRRDPYSGLHKDAVCFKLILM